MSYLGLAERIIEGDKISRGEACEILDSPPQDLLAVLDAAFRIRHHYFGRKVQIHQLINAKSGLCPEDCNYCSQSAVSEAPIDKYNLIDHEELMDGAKRAVDAGSSRGET